MGITELYKKSGRWAKGTATATGLVVVCALFIVAGSAVSPNAPGSKPADAGTTTTVVEDTAKGTGQNQFEYTNVTNGPWIKCGGCQPPTTNSSFHYSYKANNRVTLRFTGTQVVLHGVKENFGGKATVSIDGGPATTIDTYSATKLAAVIYTSPTLTAGNHTVVMTNIGQKNPSSKGITVSIDKAEAILTTPDAILLGKAGTFGNLTTSLPTGQVLETKAIDGWGFNPGQSAFFSALAPNGEVVIGTNPQTDNQAYATADHMSVGVYNPTQNSFRNIVVPTTNSSTTATNPFYTTGGASVDTLLRVNVDGQPRIAFISAVNYHGWSVAQNGEYPALGYLDTTTGSLEYNQSLSKSAGQINAYGGQSQDACPTSTNLFAEQVANCRGLAEMGLLPLSQKFVVSQYYPDVWSGESSGRIVVMNTNGSIAASYTYPNVPNGLGGYLTVNPREIITDPTSTGNLEYFSVIFDVANGSAQSIFPIQEFSYDRTTNQITPVSNPVVSGQTNASGQAYRYETAQYDALGNLWATQAITDSLEGGPLVVYAKTNGARKLQNTCAAAQPWTGAAWTSTCTPDRTAANTGQYGQTRSLVQDPQTKTMFAATLSGYLMRVKQAGTGTSLALTTLPAINIGLDQLVDRNVDYVGVRKGVVDVQNRSLYIPIVQTANPLDCPTWPTVAPCPPQTLDQWLYRFDLNALAQ